MGQTKVKVKVCNPIKPKLCRELKDVLVDTGSTDSWIPRWILREIKVPPSRKNKKIKLINGESIKRDIGAVFFEVDERGGGRGLSSLKKEMSLSSV